jgi:hypothetical protein
VDRQVDVAPFPGAGIGAGRRGVLGGGTPTQHGYEAKQHDERKRE